MRHDKAQAVESLLEEQFGVSPYDISEDDIARALEDEEDPQAIVDWLAEKYSLEKIGSHPQNQAMN